MVRSFGARRRSWALNAIRSDRYCVLVIHLGRVPAIDATGGCPQRHLLVLRAKRRSSSRPAPRPHEIFERASRTEKYAGLHVARTSVSAAPRQGARPRAGCPAAALVIGGASTPHRAPSTRRHAGQSVLLCGAYGARQFFCAPAWIHCTKSQSSGSVRRLPRGI
jgi:hypothetical protein